MQDVTITTGDTPAERVKRILVVEDAHSLRRDIVEMLGFEGYEVVDAENGKRGVERARETMPDLIICDIMMPVMNGFEVLDTLRGDRSTVTIPFIFLTARADRLDWRIGMQSGADDYLTKPFTAKELIATVKARLLRHETIIESSEQKIETLRGNIITAMPHELRTPLNVIMGFSNLLMMDAGVVDTKHIENMCGHINSAANRLYRLVENYITYGYTELLLSDEKRRALLRNGLLFHPRASLQIYIHDLVRLMGRESDLILEATDTERLSIHEDYFKKIIEELVDNACKFSNPGTKIIVKAGVEEDDMYHLRITDYGRVMTQEQITQVGAYMQFERRVHEQQGSGLGLIISRRLAELHGGSLTLNSSKENGTTVHVTFAIG